MIKASLSVLIAVLVGIILWAFLIWVVGFLNPHVILNAVLISLLFHVAFFGPVVLLVSSVSALEAAYKLKKHLALFSER